MEITVVRNNYLISGIFIKVNFVGFGELENEENQVYIEFRD